MKAGQADFKEDHGPELLMEDMDLLELMSVSMSMSMSMLTSMSMSNDDSPDCSALQQIWNNDPKSIEGSDIMVIEKHCEEGLLSTTQEVAQAIQEFELPGNPSIDKQFAVMADQICDNAPLETEDYEEVQAACNEDPRNDEKVVDALTRLAAKLSPNKDVDDARFEDICTSMEQNRNEIEEALLVLASQSDEQRRRLDDSINHQVTSFEIGSDMVSYFDCYCDKSNLDNDGCAKKALLFMEAVTSAASQEAEAMGKNFSEEFLKTYSTVEKQMNNLRGYGQIDSDEVYSNIERAMSEIQEGEEGMSVVQKGGCKAPFVKRSGSSITVCLYAGGMFNCKATWNLKTYECVKASCGGGRGAKLNAELKYNCGDAKNKLTLQLKVCVDVISQVIAKLGKHISQFESFMQESFDIHGGCLHIAYAEYDISRQRFKSTYKRKFFFPNTLFSLQGIGNSWMRFKEDGCAYGDDKTWFEKELIAYNRPSGFLFGSSGYSNGLTSVLYDEHKSGGGCVQKAGPWVMTELTFIIGHEYIDFDWFDSRVKTLEIFKSTTRFTATTNSDPSSTSLKWFELKNSQDRSLCFDVRGYGTSNGNQVFLFDCHGGDNQKFYMDSKGRIRTKLNANKCVEAGHNVDQRLKIWTCGDHLWQQWEFTDDNRLKNKAKNKYIGVVKGCDSNGVNKRDALGMESKVSGTTSQCALKQQWHELPAPVIKEFHNAMNQDLCMDVNRGETHNGNKVQLWTCNHSNAQKFFMDEKGRIRSRLDVNKCIEAGGDVGLYAKLFIWDCHDRIHQQWKVTDERKVCNKKNGRCIGVSGGCGGVEKGDRLEAHNVFGGTGICSVQQQWLLI